ncbi:unnamed protein product [Auanema sp. JU1783]|nr:unnamed protein product [Auanema sp. JU1783]
MAVIPASLPASKIEKETIRELREKLIEVLADGIPEDLDTELNLLRWIRGNQSDIGRILEIFPTYVASRQAAGFTGKNLEERYFEMPHVKPFLKYIASSRLSDSQWSEEHNAFLFVERAWSQPREFIKTFKVSDYQMHCFGYSEFLLQLILEREKNQSPDKGPVQFIVIFDLMTVNITDYVNPMSGYMKMWQLRSDLWQDWFPDMVQGIYLVNPPRLVSVLWKIARLFLSEHNLKRIEIISDEKEFTKHLPKWFIPKEYGGDFIAQRPHGDESGVSIRQKITSADFYVPYQHYKNHGVERPKHNRKDISPGEAFIIPITVPEGKSLLWDFTVSGEVEFFIYRNKQQHDMVFPRFRLITSKLNEEGSLDNLPDAEYSLFFLNKSGYFTVKLEYCIVVA